MPDTLETALRELREPASPEFAADLNARVAGGFGTTPGRLGAPAPRPRKAPGWLRRHLLPVTGFAAAAALLFVVVSIGSNLDTTGGDGGSGASSGGSSASSSSEAVQDTAATTSRAAGSSRKAAPQLQSLKPGAAQAPGTRNRRVERTASLTLTAPARRIERVAAGVSDVAGRYGGYVQSSSIDAARTSGGGEFVLRLPTRRLDAAMAALARVGTVTNRRQTSEDITAQHDSARSRLAEARAERTSLLKRLAAATTDAQTASLRGRLADANAAIDRALTAVRRVDRRARYARVDVTLRSRGGAATTPPSTDGQWGPGAAWEDAQRVLEIGAGVLVVALAVTLPLSLILFLGLGTRRVATARARSRVLDSV